MNRSSIYTPSGPVQSGSGIYIRRKADDELLELCRQSEFGYVLTSRQLGKTSLMFRTDRQLDDEHLRSVIIDLEQVGAGKSTVNAEKWYLSVLDIIKKKLDLNTDITAWWKERWHLGKTMRLTRFFEEILLKEIKEPVVIFFDEIDTLLSLEFTDDFLAAIRYLYNARAQVPELKRLSIVLIGAAVPSDLIHDTKRTPFNIGRRVDLTDFTFDEALPLADGLGLPDQETRRVLNWVLKWTNGHPNLTQKALIALANRHHDNWTEDEVDTLIGDTFFNPEKPDPNLENVGLDFTKRAPKRERAKVLATYKAIRIGKETVFDEEHSPAKSRLKLSGVVCRERIGTGSHEHLLTKRNQDSLHRFTLRVRNKVYRKEFDEAWIRDREDELPLDWFTRAKRAGLWIAAVLIVASISSSAYFRYQAQKSERERDLAVNARLSAISDLDLGYKVFQDYGITKESGIDPEPSDLQKERLKVVEDVIYDNLQYGSLKYSLFDDYTILLTRTSPAPNSLSSYTWISRPPTDLTPPPGRIDKTGANKGSSFFGSNNPQYPLALLTFLNARTTAAPVGQCINPHPGPFRSWYGAKNGCWVAVYREWQDGCQHYQWYNACYDVWDNYPNGAPKVYWTKCVH